MNNEWTEGRESTVRFPSDSAETFEYYLGVLYCNAVPNISGATEGITFRVLVNLYVLAEKLVDIKTKNIVVEAILGRLKEFKWPLADVIRGLYEGTPSGSPARRLLADRFAEVGDVEKHLSLGSTVLPQDFWIDITKALTAYRERLIKRGPMKSVFEGLADYMEQLPESPCNNN